MLADIQNSLVQIRLGNAALIIAGIFLALPCAVRVLTTIHYRRAVAHNESVSRDGIVPSPLLPYSIPWFGHTLRFFEKHAKRWHHRQTIHPPHGIYSMLVLGRKTHIITNDAATRHLFRHAYTQGLTREFFVRDLLIKCLLVSPVDASHINTGEGRKQQEDVFHKYLARKEAVTELTLMFSDRLSQVYRKITTRNDTMENVNLYAWLRSRIFSISLTVFFGEELLRLYPGICDDIFGFDEDLCTFFFGLPRFLNATAWKRRQRILDSLMKWDKLIHSMGKETAKDSTHSTSWDPAFGSRFNRARFNLYRDLNLSSSSRAGMNLSIMFALASNVVPAIGWMLLHILAGPDNQRLLKLVRQEVDLAVKPDGTLDVSTLLSASPLLQSIWTEVLRHYCDNMIMRDVVEDATIPLDEQGTKWMKTDKGDLIISPCWIAHHEATNWQDEEFQQSPEYFVADRFVGKNLTSAKASALAGVPSAKMYPFGGGKSICAGRIFAKEEAIVTVAQTLLNFDFDVKGFLDAKGNAASSFPRLTPSLPGGVIYVPQDDLLVTIRNREAKV